MRIPFFFWAVLVGASALAQEQIGIAAGPWAGTDAVALNPARMAGQWPWLDVNLVGVSAFVRNDGVFVPGGNHPFWSEVSTGIAGRWDALPLALSSTPGKREAFVQASVHGPSIALSLGKLSLGAHVTGRTLTSAVGVPQALAEVAFHGFEHEPLFGERSTMRNMRVLSASWLQYGGSAAYLVMNEGYGMLGVGATVKRLVGFHGVGFVMETLDYTLANDSSFTLHEASGSYGFASPGFGAGKGWGFDLGAHYTRTLNEVGKQVPHKPSAGCTPMPYRYRVGLSILDLGGMGFPGGSGARLSGAEGSFSSNADPDSEQEVDSLVRASVDEFSGTGSLRIGLPTAVALEYDYSFSPTMFASVVALQQLSFPNSYRLRRPNTLAVTVRYATKRLELAVPLVLHEYQRPTMGFMLRLNSIVIGSDHLLPLISRRNIDGVDVYLRVKVTLFKSPWCTGKTNRRGGSPDRVLPCSQPQ
jgi:Family of unknown function (DUF5723)